MRIGRMKRKPAAGKRLSRGTMKSARSYKLRLARRRKYHTHSNYLRVTKTWENPDFAPVVAAGQYAVQGTTYLLDSMPNADKFKALYSQFKINWIKINLKNIDNKNSTNTQLYKGQFYTAVIKDGAWPTTIDEMRALPNHRMYTQGRDATIMFRPTSRYVQDTGVISNNYGFRSGQWFETNVDGAQPHYGTIIMFKAPLSGPGNAIEWTRYNFEITYNVTFRRIRLAA